MSSYADLKAKQTEAIPPRSLFGTVAEIKDKTAQKAAAEIRTPTALITPDKFARYRPRDADEVIKNAEEQYKSQKDKASEAHGRLLETEAKAFNFQPDPHTVSQNNHQCGHKKASSSTGKGHEGSSRQVRNSALQDEYSRLASDLQQDFPCHHFREPPSNETYQMLGNALGKGGNVSYRGKEYATVSSRSGRKKSDLTSRNSVRPSPRPPSVPIPANIRHKYGSTICSNVLEDAELLLEEGTTSPARPGAVSESGSGTPRSTSRTSSRKSGTVDTLYDGLSNALRQDIFNGVSYSHLKSLSASSYTGDGAKKTTETYPPKFAVMRNEDSKWNEDMVIYQKLMKEWDAVMAERAKPAES